MQASTKFNPIHFSLSILLAGYLLLPGFRAIFKYSPYPSLICCLYLIFVSLFLLLLVNGKLEKIQWVIGNPLSISLFLLAVAIACWIAYPFADALKLNMQGFHYILFPKNLLPPKIKNYTVDVRCFYDNINFITIHNLVIEQPADMTLPDPFPQDTIPK